MQTEQIVAILIQERDRLSRAIEALQSKAPRRAAASHTGATPAQKAPTKARRKRVLSAAGRNAIAEAAKKRWAAVRAAREKSGAAKPAEPKNRKARA